MSSFFAVLAYYFTVFAALYAVILLLARLFRTLQSRRASGRDADVPTNRSAEQDEDPKPDNAPS